MLKEGGKTSMRGIQPTPRWFLNGKPRFREPLLSDLLGLELGARVLFEMTWGKWLRANLPRSHP